MEADFAQLCIKSAGLKTVFHKILSMSIMDKAIFDDDNLTMNPSHLLDIESIDRF